MKARHQGQDQTSKDESLEFSTWLENSGSTHHDANPVTVESLGDKLSELSLDDLAEVHDCLSLLENVWPTPRLADPGSLQQVGPYRLIRNLGSGGMGEVWEAEQTEPIQRRLAVKLIRNDLFSRDAIQRFESERRVLAQLEHPNVARIIDAGMTEQSQLFFAMELVDGIPIASYCRKKNLSLRERIQLVISVCSGIQHAHQKGIIHRDLKPANILVTEVDHYPVPKIIDFGLAKLAEETETESTISTNSTSLQKTQLGTILGTLEYMSPEQANGDQANVDTRSDTYSLGVLLFEILTGTTPVRMNLKNGRSRESVTQQILNETPPMASSVLSDAENLSSKKKPHQIAASELKNDLDWVVAKSLSRNPAERYSNVAEFSGDLQRFLDHEPVQARPYSLGYATSKLLRRHAAFAFASILLTTVLIAGIIGTTTGWISSARAREQAEASLLQTKKSNKILSDIFADLDISAIDRSDKPLQMVFAGRLEKAGQQILDGSFDDQLEVAAMLADVSQSLNALGSPEAAIPFAKSAYEIAQQEKGANSQLARRYGVQLASSFRGSGEMKKANQILDSLLSFCRSQLASMSPEKLPVIDELARLKFDEGDFQVSLPLYEEALAIRQHLPEQSEFELSETEFGIASCYLSMRMPDKARAIFDRVLEFRRENLAPGHPEIIETLNFISSACERTQDPNIRARGNQLAKEVFELSIATYGRQHRKTYEAMRRYGANIFESHEIELGQQLVEDALAGLNETCGPNHPLTEFAKSTLAQIYVNTENWNDAVELLKSNLKNSIDALGAGHPSAIATQLRLSNIYWRVKEFDRALEQLTTAQANVVDSRQKSRVVLALGATHSLIGNHQAAIEHMKSIAPEPHQVGGTEYIDAVVGKFLYARALSRKGSSEQALQQLDECETIMNNFAPKSGLIPSISAHRGIVLSESGDLIEGIKLMENFAKSGTRLQDSDSFFESLHDAYGSSERPDRIAFSIEKLESFSRRTSPPNSIFLARRLSWLAAEAIRFELWNLGHGFLAEANKIYTSENRDSWGTLLSGLQLELANLGTLMGEEKDSPDLQQSQLAIVKIAQKHYRDLMSCKEEVFNRDKLALKMTCEKFNTLLERNGLKKEARQWQELTNSR